MNKYESESSIENQLDDNKSSITVENKIIQRLNNFSSPLRNLSFVNKNLIPKSGFNSDSEVNGLKGQNKSINSSYKKFSSSNIHFQNEEEVKISISNPIEGVNFSKSKCGYYSDEGELIFFH